MLKGFHIYAARRITGMIPRKRRNGEWVYPNSVTVLKAAGLRTINHYIVVRQTTVADYIVHRPIFEMVKGVQRQQGTVPRQYWWDQELGLGL